VIIRVKEEMLCDNLISCLLAPVAFCELLDSGIIENACGVPPRGY